MRYNIATLLALLPVAMTTTAADLKETTASQLAQEYVRTPYAHPNIPNVAFAGYAYGEKPLPEPAVVADVRKEGAKGDGKADDTAAFKSAIAKASKGGAVLVPAGEYKLTDLLALSQPGIVLRGEGAEKSVLLFEKPVGQLLPFMTGSRPSWYGGLIWIEPGEPKEPKDAEAAPTQLPVTAPAKMGDFQVELAAADAAKLQPLIGQMVQMTWQGDKSLAMHIAGHPSMESYDWNSWAMMSDGKLTWHWANEITGVQGTRVTFKKPLRLDIRPEWKVSVNIGREYLSNCGVEKLTIRFPETKKAAHLKDPGYNGIMLRNAAHCWVRDVTVTNTDNAIVFGGEDINCTVTGLRITGRPNHHGTMMRAMSHDNVIEHFKIESKPHHGINTEGVSSGNVWRAGEMADGTFDSHCMMSFDSVRTAIKVNNTGGPGGAGDHGPFVGRRMVSWNIEITNGKGEWIAQPAIFPSGAIVGVRGAPLELKADDLWHMPPGLEKGCVVADMGEELRAPDLYEAQLKNRLHREGQR